MSGSTDGAPQEKPYVKLVGEDVNAFAILGRVRRALVAAGASREYVERYTREATKGDYSRLLAVTLEYVDEAGDECIAEDDSACKYADE